MADVKFSEIASGAAFVQATDTLLAVRGGTTDVLVTLSLNNGLLGSVGIVIDGSGSAITTGQKGYVKCPYAGTITAAYLVADQSGSVIIDVWKIASGGIPTVANTITASALPTLSSAQQSTNSTLTGWTTAVTVGDVFGFNVNSASTVTRVTLQLLITKS